MAVVSGVFVFLFLFFTPILCKPLNTSRTLTNDNLSHIKNAKLLPQDHIKGLKLERDGHVNKDYHHEAFLGKMVEDGTLLFDNMEGYRRLIDLFHKVDRDGDHAVSKAELTVWIHDKIREHIQEAQDNNHALFKTVDLDGDGFVTWNEFRQKLNEDNNTKQHEKREKELDDVGVEDDALPEWYSKFRRGDMNLDDKLEENEFLYFQHPEHNPQSIKDLVEDMIFNFDRNHDKVLTKTEFLHLPPGEVDTQQEADLDNEYVQEREKEFIVMDEDGDGIVTSEELTKYLDPSHEQRAVNEANYLVTMADRNHDGLLDEKEILMDFQLFTGSSMANFAGYLHDEF